MTTQTTEVKSDVFVRIKSKKAPREKVPAELTDKIKTVTVEVDESFTDTNECFEVNIHFQARDGSKLTKADSGKTA